jgi:hypothetical protein
MKGFAKDELVHGSVDHPYETNPDLLASVNCFYLIYPLTREINDLNASFLLRAAGPA